MLYFLRDVLIVVLILLILRKTRTFDCVLPVTIGVDNCMHGEEF